jgi:hypothetical protein
MGSAERINSTLAGRGAVKDQKLTRGDLVLPAKPRGHRSENRQRKKRRLFDHKEKIPLVYRDQRTIRLYLFLKNVGQLHVRFIRFDLRNAETERID